MSLKIIWGDITKEKTDAIVTLASSEPKVGSGVDKFVHAAAGPGLLEARLKEVNFQTLGRIVCTNSFGLWETCGAKYVIHASSVFWENGASSETVLLNAVYMKAVVVANWRHCKTVTFPLIGSGKFGMPEETAIDCAVISLQECAKYFPGMRIKLVIVDQKIFSIAQRKYPKLCKLSSQSKLAGDDLMKCSSIRGYTDEEILLRYLETPPENVSAYWRGVVKRALSRIGSITDIMKFMWEHVRMRDRRIYQTFQRECRWLKPDRRESEMRRRLENSCMLLRTIKDLEMASQVPWRRIKHILERDVTKPAREDVLALCVALRVPSYCVEAVLSRAGHSDLWKSKCDRSVLAYMETGAFMVADLNEDLKSKKLDPLLPPLPKKDGDCKPQKANCKRAQSRRA